MQVQVVGQPEGAGQERAFARRQAVDARARDVAGDEAVRQQVALDRRHACRASRGSSAGRKPTSGIISRLASRSCEPYDCTNELELGVETLAADLGMDGVAQLPPALERPFEAEAARRP